MQFLQRFLDPGKADAAFVRVQHLTLPGHAPFHQRITVLIGQLRKEDVRNLRHYLAEDRLQHIRIHAEPLITFLNQLGIVAFRHQSPGIPKGSVDIENQTFKIHIMLSPVLPDAAQYGP